MIKNQLDKAKQLILEQWKKTLGKDIQKHIEAEQLLNDQIWDEKTDRRIKPQIIETSKKRYSHIEIKKRAIIVMRQSGEFTYEEIAILISNEIRQYTPKQIERIFKSF